MLRYAQYIALVLTKLEVLDSQVVAFSQVRQREHGSVT